MKKDEIINRHPNITGGTPVFSGTSVLVRSLIAHLKNGVTLDEFLDDFPSVSRKQAEAFLEMAGNSLLENKKDACPA